MINSKFEPMINSKLEPVINSVLANLNCWLKRIGLASMLGKPNS